jgi:hypothetical protein
MARWTSAECYNRLYATQSPVYLETSDLFTAFWQALERHGPARLALCAPSSQWRLCLGAVAASRKSAKRALRALHSAAALRTEGFWVEELFVHVKKQDRGSLGQALKRIALRHLCGELDKVIVERRIYCLVCVQMRTLLMAAFASIAPESHLRSYLSASSNYRPHLHRRCALLVSTVLGLLERIQACAENLV